MIVAYSYIPVLEEILIEKLTKYLNEDCKWKDQFPNHPYVRINNEFPWVPYMQRKKFFTDGYIDLSDVQETLFPSVTITTSQDVKSPQMYHSSKKTALLKEEMPEFKLQAAEEGYLISPEALAAMDTHFETNDILYGAYIKFQLRDTLNFDITTDDNTNIKNRLYDLIKLYLVGHGKEELYSIDDERKIELSDDISGNRSGTYNIDFGRVLRGATMQLNADYFISQTFYNTDAGTIGDIVIDHTISVKGQ
jgi:hypothetical protein